MKGTCHGCEALLTEADENDFYCVDCQGRLRAEEMMDFYGYPHGWLERSVHQATFNDFMKQKERR